MQTTLRIILFGVTLWLIGFYWFVQQLPREGDLEVAIDVAELTRENTGIVALTGGGGTRIEAAMTLLGQNAGSKMLISGVHPETRKDEIAAQIEVDAHLLTCCVDLGQQAETTRGNALEAHEWVRAHGYENLILVTTDYHIPRATAEIHALLPDVTIIAYPVASRAAPKEDWHRSPDAWRILIMEYMKFLAVKTGQLLPWN